MCLEGWTENESGVCSCDGKASRAVKVSVFLFGRQQKLCSETELSLPAIYLAQVCCRNYNFTSQ